MTCALCRYYDICIFHDPQSDFCNEMDLVIKDYSNL